MAITLQPYNTISLSAGTPTQLVGPLSGHYWIQILNQGGGNVGVADTSAASGGSGAFTLLPNLSVTPYVYGPSGIWVNAAAASQISVALMPVSGYTPCSAGAVQGGAATPAGTTGQVQWNNGLQMGASANLFWNNTTGRLGIHNASPAYTLDVVGNCNIAGALTVNGSPVGAGGTQWITSGSNIYYSAGNVGIGTTNPQVLLDLPNQVANNSIARFGSIELQSLNAGNTFVCSNVYWNGSAYIYRATGSANLINFQNGDISFMTALSGTGGTTASLAFEFRILAAGGIYIPNLPTVSPGAGSKQIWADPADSYRVKFAN